MRIYANSLVLAAALLGAVVTAVKAESKGLRGQKPSMGSGNSPTEVVLDALGSVNVDDSRQTHRMEAAGRGRMGPFCHLTPDRSMIDSFVERGRTLQEADKRLGDGQLFDRAAGYQPLQPEGGRPREEGPIVPPDGSMIDSFVERVREVREGWEDRTMTRPTQTGNTEGRRLQEADKRLGDGQLFDRAAGYEPLQPGGGRPREDGPVMRPDGSMLDTFVERVREVREGWEDSTINPSSRSSNEVTGR